MKKKCLFIFVCEAINVGDITTSYINSLKQMLAESECNSFLRDFLLNSTIAVFNRESLVCVW